MGSSFFGKPNMGGSSISSSSSSRKGKKNNSDKPKQPQRGLGVAQLEKIRLHGEMSCNSFQYPSLHSPYPTAFNQEDTRMQGGYSSIPSSPSYGFRPSMMMGLSEYERASMRYGDSQPSTTASWNPGYGILESQYLTQPSKTRHFLNLHVEDSSFKHRSSKSMGSNSHDSGSSDKELDLELRLSL